MMLTLDVWPYSGVGKWASWQFAKGNIVLLFRSVSSCAWWVHLEFGWCTLPAGCTRSRGPRRRARILPRASDSKICGFWSRWWAEWGWGYLLFSAGAVEWAFRYDLCCWDAFCFQISHFIALGEATAAQRLALGVLFYHCLPVGFGDFLLDDRLLDRQLLVALFRLVHSNIISYQHRAQIKYHLHRNKARKMKVLLGEKRDMEALKNGGIFLLDTLAVMMVSEEFEAEPQESQVLIA